MLLPVFARFDYADHSELKTQEKEEFESLKNHNITLASFVTVLIAVILAFPQDENQDRVLQNIDSLFYFSISMTFSLLHHTSHYFR